MGELNFDVMLLVSGPGQEVERVMVRSVCDIRVHCISGGLGFWRREGPLSCHGELDGEGWVVEIHDKVLELGRSKAVGP
jgi:hypothetical protein